MTGELTDTDGIDRAVGGADAVLSLLGPGNRKTQGTPIADGTARIIGAMQTHDVGRLVASATFSATDPADHRSPLVRVMVGGVRAFVPHAYRDIVATAQTVRDTELDSTLVRVGLLHDGDATPEVAAGPLGSGVGVRLARANFARFVLCQAGDDRWSRQAPAISDPADRHLEASPS